MGEPFQLGVMIGTWPVCLTLAFPLSDRQYQRSVIEYQLLQSLVVIEYHCVFAQGEPMKHLLLKPALIAALLALATPVMAADCYADYKAKQDSPLRLHYGVIQLSGACQKGAAKAEIGNRIAPQGWTLLNVISVFGPEGLQQRKPNAGSYYLRF